MADKPPVDLAVIRGQKEQKEAAENGCWFCDKGPHSPPLACNRVEYVVLDQEGGVGEIHLWPKFGDDKSAA